MCPAPPAKPQQPPSFRPSTSPAHSADEPAAALLPSISPCGSLLSHLSLSELVSQATMDSPRSSLAAAWIWRLTGVHSSASIRRPTKSLESAMAVRTHLLPSHPAPLLLCF